MERVVAVTSISESVAYPFSVLRDVPVVNDDFDGKPIVIFWAPGTASALDRAKIADGRDVGSSGVFLRRVGNRDLTFESAGDHHFRDRETGTKWNILGRAVEGELEGTELQPIPHGNHFWFAWGAFRPDTRVFRK